MTRDERIARGHRAEMLLNDEVVQAILSDIETGYVEAWRATDIKDTEQRESLYFAVRVVDQFRQQLRVVRDSGKFEQTKVK
jgi:hypothetical protein